MLLVDTNKLPTKTGKTVELDTQITYTDLRPSPRRLLGAEAHALHYEYTTVTRVELDDNIRFRFDHRTFSAAGPVFIEHITRKTTNTCSMSDWEDAKTDDEKARYVTRLYDMPRTVSPPMNLGEVSAFRKFFNLYHEATASSSVTWDHGGTELSIRLASTDSPLIYPLNNTNLKHLSSDSSKKHAKYLHDQMASIWSHFDRAVETADQSEFYVPLNLECGVKGKSLAKGSVLYHTIVALFDARVGEDPKDNEINAVPSSKFVTPFFSKKD